VRAKKRIILVDANENRRSVLAYLLTIHSYKIVTEGPCDLVIGCWPCGDEFVGLASIHSAPSLLLSEGEQKKSENLPCTHRLGNTEPFIVLEAVAMASARKRGPRKSILSFVSQTDAGRKAG
jgi:hypothetical protein